MEFEPGDKAIDGAIAMEAIFLADGKPELTYRLRVRAARFLGTSIKEREMISASIKDFYDLRSAIVHGSKDASGIVGAGEIVEAGLNYVQSAARRICEAGEMPDWGALELG